MNKTLGKKRHSRYLGKRAGGGGVRERGALIQSMTDVVRHSPSQPYKARTENVGFPSTRQIMPEGGGGVCAHLMHRRDPRIPTRTMPGWSTSGFHRPGRHRVHQSAKRREVFGESHRGLTISHAVQTRTLLRQPGLFGVADSALVVISFLRFPL